MTPEQCEDLIESAKKVIIDPTLGGETLVLKPLGPREPTGLLTHDESWSFIEAIARAWDEGYAAGNLATNPYRAKSECRHLIDSVDVNGRCIDCGTQL